MITQSDKKIAVFNEFVGPCLQVLIISALLVASFGSPVLNLGSAILSIIWLKTSRNEDPQDFMRILAHRKLYKQVGEWLEKEDEAGEAFDRAFSEYLGFHEGLDHPLYVFVAKVTGFANLLRSFAASLLYGYTLFLSVVIYADWWLDGL